MKKYTATAVLSYIATVEVEAETITKAEELAAQKLDAIETMQHEDIVFKPVETAEEHVTAEPLDETKAPNVCIACEG